MKSDRTEAIVRSYENWLRKYDWTWWGTLKVTAGVPTDKEAHRLFNEWITELNRVDGNDDFRWVRAMEKGRGGNNRHFHILVGGLRSQRAEATRRWRYLGGDALIEPYDPNKNAVLYMLKTIDADGNCDLDFRLPTRGDGMAAAPAAIRDVADQRAATTKTLLRVANFGSDTNPRQLWKFFSGYGAVSAVHTETYRTHSFALVEIDAEDIEEVVRFVNERLWRGRRLTAEITHPESSW